MTTSKLQGWDYINSLINKCPFCGQKGVLGNPANSDKWQVACMNNMCSNFYTTQHYNSYWFAIHEWNEKYKRQEVFYDNTTNN